jgi:hypothetical protein
VILAAHQLLSSLFERKSLISFLLRRYDLNDGVAK